MMRRRAAGHSEKAETLQHLSDMNSDWHSGGLLGTTTWIEGGEGGETRPVRLSRCCPWTEMGRVDREDKDACSSKSPCWLGRRVEEKLSTELFLEVGLHDTGVGDTAHDKVDALLTEVKSSRQRGMDCAHDREKCGKVKLCGEERCGRQGAGRSNGGHSFERNLPRILPHTTSSGGATGNTLYNEGRRGPWQRIPQWMDTYTFHLGCPASVQPNLNHIHVICSSPEREAACSSSPASTDVEFLNTEKSGKREEGGEGRRTFSLTFLLQRISPSMCWVMNPLKSCVLRLLPRLPFFQ